MLERLVDSFAEHDGVQCTTLAPAPTTFAPHTPWDEARPGGLPGSRVTCLVDGHAPRPPWRLKAGQVVGVPAVGVPDAGKMTPQAMRPPLLPVGSVFRSSSFAWMISAVPPAC